jgi:hypothetical protein
MCLKRKRQNRLCVRSELHANKGDIKREPITAKNDKNALQLIVEEL